jgi:hypothetical protein
VWVKELSTPAVPPSASYLQVNKGYFLPGVTSKYSLLPVVAFPLFLPNQKSKENEYSHQ